MDGGQRDQFSSSSHFFLAPCHETSRQLTMITQQDSMTDALGHSLLLLRLWMEGTDLVGSVGYH